MTGHDGTPWGERDDDGFGPVLRSGSPTTATDDYGPVLRGAYRDAGREPARPGDGFGPAARPQRRWPRRIAKTLLAVLLLVPVLLLATAGALLLVVSSSMQRIDVAHLGTAVQRMNVLVVGSDSREGLTPEELQALGTEAVAGERTDTILVLSVQGGRAAMLSFPRDLLVQRCDGRRARVNSAYAQGGPDCLVQTIEQTSGIPLHHYVQVNLGGFKRVVDAVGGVELYLEEPLVDRFAGVDLPAGCVVLDGRSALGFVRARKVDSDLGRIGRQQRFVAELAQEITEPRTLVDVPRLFAVARAAGAAVTADQDLGVLDLLRLARAARGFAGPGLASYTVPATPAVVGGAAVLVPTGGEAEALFEQFRSGAVLAPPPPQPDAPTAPAPDPQQAPPPAAGETPAGTPDC